MHLVRRMRIIALAFALLSLSTGAGAQQPAAASSAGMRHGFSVARLARIDSTFQRLVEQGEVAGAVTLVLRDGQPVYQRAFGWADREARRPTAPDAVFRIASQTKALTSAAIMMLAEEGKLTLDDPVTKA